MAFYVIAGQTDCVQFVHALQIANYLYERLPNFDVYRISKDPEEYWIWLKELNKERGWHHMSSPLVWKEVSMKGGRPYIIGGLSEFWEYIYDYYGLKTTLTKEDIQALMRETLMLEQDDQRAKQKLLENSVNISICADFQSGVYMFIWHLLHDTVGLKEKHLTFKLYDCHLDNKKEGALLTFIADLEDTVLCRREQAVSKMKIVDSLEKAVTDCDLLIIFNEFKRRPDDSEYDYHRRGLFELSYMADQINLYAKRSLRIILAQSNLVCWNATVLLHRCTTIKLSNIVAVTADLGLSALEIVKNKCSVPIEKSHAPPVWGFVGVNSFIDIRNTIVQAEYCLPYLRAVKVKSIKESTLPKGEITTQLRLMSYLIGPDFDLEKELKAWKGKFKKTVHRPSLSKIRALISLINCWYSPKEDDSIICLGVCSNGTFGIPARMVFSQPVILNRDTGTWVPYQSIPMNDATNEKISKMVSEAEAIIEELL